MDRADLKKVADNLCEAEKGIWNIVEFVEQHEHYLDPITKHIYENLLELHGYAFQMFDEVSTIAEM
jgi:hypothetical protein